MVEDKMRTIDWDRFRHIYSFKLEPKKLSNELNQNQKLGEYSDTTLKFLEPTPGDRFDQHYPELFGIIRSPSESSGVGVRVRVNRNRSCLGSKSSESELSGIILRLSCPESESVSSGVGVARSQNQPESKGVDGNQSRLASVNFLYQPL